MEGGLGAGENMVRGLIWALLLVWNVGAGDGCRFAGGFVVSKFGGLLCGVE